MKAHKNYWIGTQTSKEDSGLSDEVPTCLLNM